MQISTFNIITAVWLFLCFVSPLRSKAQPYYSTNYGLYDPASSRFYPAENAKIQPRQNIRKDELPPRRIEYNYETSNFREPWNPIKYAYPTRTRILETEHIPKQTGEERFLYAYGNPEQDYKKEGNTKRDKVSFQELHDHDGGKNISEETKDEKEEEIMRKMSILEKLLSEDPGERNIEMNTIEEQIISETNIPEETKRVVRQVRKQRPGFFWTLARITFETFNDTRSAIKQISEIISNNIAPDPTTQKSITSGSLRVSSTTPATMSKDQSNMPSNMANVNITTTTATPTTTTEESFVLTRSGLQNIIRRNLLGLIRLFNIEWNEAINQSEITAKEFQKELGQQVGTFLQDNPDAY